MPHIEVPIHEILTDPDKPFDLGTVSPGEAMKRIGELYGFLPSVENVSIANDIATITIPEDSPYRVDEAFRTSRRGARAAERGNYQAAKEMFEDALEVIPYHAGTRRDLGMTYMEMGEADKAKQYVVEAIRLESDDAWSYVVLGNIYLKMEGKPELAERYYQKAHDIDPTDAYALNSLGALKAKRRQYEEARSHFNRAIEEDPDYPHPRYGLALCYVEEGKLEPALTALEELCAPPRSRDARSGPVYREARALYLDVNRRLAQQNQATMLEQIKEAMEEFGAASGTPIEMVEDNSLDVFATTQLAWVHGRDRHIIRYRATVPETVPYYLGQQFEHIRLSYRARQAGRGRVLISPPSRREYAIRLVGKDAGGLRQQGISGAMLDRYLEQLIDGLLRQLYNAPMELFTEYQLYHYFPSLRPSQVVSLDLTHQQNVQALTDESVRAMSPRVVYDANIAMNCAYALFTDFLFNEATNYSEPYQTSRAYSTGRRLFELWQREVSTFEPGDEYGLVDEFAGILNLQRWYDWGPVEEAEPSQSAEPEPTPEGVTNEELLKQKESAAVMYLLDALQRFEGMDEGRIQQVAFEIAMLGRSGLDYASSEKKYTLRSLPGERFSGLHLMALMYAGFKRIDPSLDTGMPFDGAYATALAMYKPGK